ncbi:MAG: ABC transporter ATP-binding protein [Planctomycetes bacterium]|nr:ABC transporter ATP-binding protein [Planctomycetota bacterium]
MTTLPESGPAAAPPAPGPDGVVWARGLRKSYGAFDAVRGIDFAVRAGECFGFLGPNGAGKTSTMKMIYGACSISGGDLSVFGVDARSDMRRIKRSLGVVPQENNLETELTVRQNLEVFARYFRLSRAEAEARIGELLEVFQLAEKAEVEADKLSGGMKRRLITARALLARPTLLILDEPTTALDPQARHLLWDKLRELRRAGVTQILTTHYMDEAERLCDRLVIMDGGRIIEGGSPAELIARHIGRQVLELTAPAADVPRILAAAQAEPGAPDAAPAGGAPARHELVPEGVLLFAADAEATLHRVRAAGVPIGAARLRQATLEDVFLKVAGRRLSD